MVPEKDIIRQEELDLRAVAERFFRSWPLLLAILILFVALGVAFQLVFPVWHKTTMKVQVDKPKGVNDPGTMISSVPLFVKPDDSYNVNLKVLLTSFPILKEAIERTEMTLQYVNKGVILDTDIYGKSPIRVELDSTYMSFEEHLTPYGTPFYVSFLNENMYKLNAEGVYPISKNEFEFEGEFAFNEWVTFGDMKFRVIKNDTLMNPKITLYNDLEEDDFGFVMRSSHKLALQYTEDISVEAADVEATVYNVSVIDESPDRQADLLNNVSDIIIERHMSSKTESLDRAVAFLTEEVNKISKTLAISEDTLQKFKSEKGITSFGREGDLVVEKSNRLENQKVDLLVRRKYFKYLKDFLNENDDFGGLISPQAFGIDDRLISELTTELVELEYEKNNLARRSNEDNPMLIQLKEKISSNREVILSSISGLEESNRMLIANVNSELNKLQNESRTLPEEERDLLRLDRMYRLNERLYSSLVDKKYEAELARISTSSDFTVVAPAYKSSIEPILPNPIITLLAVILLSIIFSVLAVVIRNLFNNKIQASVDLNRYVPSLPVLGEFENSEILFPAKLTAYPNSKASEDLNGILYALENRLKGSNIISTSGFSYDAGAGTLISLLATRKGLMGKSVVVVDLNLAKPALHQKFGVKRSAGISDVLMGSASVSEAESSTGHAGVTLISAGSIARGDLREKIDLHPVLQELSSKYDFVFLALEPFGISTRSLMVQSLCGFNIVVARRGETSYTELERIQNMVVVGNIKNAGIVLTDTFAAGYQFLTRSRSKVYDNPKTGFFTHLKLLVKRV